MQNCTVVFEPQCWPALSQHLFGRCHCANIHCLQIMNRFKVKLGANLQIPVRRSCHHSGDLWIFRIFMWPLSLFISITIVAFSSHLASATCQSTAIQVDYQFYLTFSITPFFMWNSVTEICVRYYRTVIQCCTQLHWLDKQSTLRKRHKIQKNTK